MLPAPFISQEESEGKAGSKGDIIKMGNADVIADQLERTNLGRGSKGCSFPFYQYTGLLQNDTTFRDTCDMGLFTNYNLALSLLVKNLHYFYINLTLVFASSHRHR